ncbi:MAG: MFS transporter [Acidobacteria bacterium]|nr:MFS transporter [Acidobacteriota bacterium]
MTNETGDSAAAAVSTWRYPKNFWIANGVELFERAAYYGTFIALALFLTDVVGFTDVEAGWIGALFASFIYLLPFVSGAAADRIGFRYSLVIAFLLLGVGYATLGLYPTKVAVLGSLALICVGGSIVKPTITGTVARSSDSLNRARAFSIFYMIVNIGSFSGKTIAKPVRTMLGLEYVPLYSSAAAFLALVLVVFFYWPKDELEQRPRSALEAIRDLGLVFRNGRFMALLLITAGFWAIQGQLYASLPKYVIRMVGPDASPEWYANVNPLIVVLLVVPITQLVKKLEPVTSIGISLALIPCSALIMAFSGLFERPIVIAGFSMHPITVMMVLGIALQGFAECFLSPRYLEYASKQAPPGQEGLYMGYAHLNTFFAWLTGFVLSGYLLDAFCPDPKKLAAAGLSAEQVKAAYAHAPYLWYTFAGVGVAAFVALLIFKFVTERVDDAGRAKL